MSSYIFCLSRVDASNWAICKSDHVLGVRTSPSSHRSANQLSVGDAVYVWQGGGSKPGSGLIARAIVSSPALPAIDPPWPNPENYSYVVPISDIEELDSPVSDRFPGNGRGVLFGIQNTDLQKGLRPLEESSLMRLASCFPSTVHDADPQRTDEFPSVSTAGGGWSSDQELIRAVELAAVERARDHLKSLEWRELRDCQQDGCGYDFLYADPNESLRKVEFKGTAGSDLRFLLTRKEHDILETDPNALVVVVVDVFNIGQVHLLRQSDISDIGLRPDRWQVGGGRASWAALP